MRRPLLVGISAALLLVGLFAATCGGNGDDGGDHNDDTRGHHAG